MWPVLFFSCGPQLASLRERNRILEEAAQKVDDERAALATLKEDVLPIYASLQKDAAEDKLWHDAVKVPPTSRLPHASLLQWRPAAVSV